VPSIEFRGANHGVRDELRCTVGDVMALIKGAILKPEICAEIDDYRPAVIQFFGLLC
jgi:hypothetical protein